MEGISQNNRFDTQNFGMVPNGRILSPEELEKFLTDGHPVKTAIRTVYRKGDIVEVRAWDKDHNVYTGRYKYGAQLVKMVELFDREGCDVYFVLNPVGDKLGVRDISSGGLCTWENDVPWRRWFLLDFDPLREHKIATENQFQAAYHAASAAKVWLEGYGWQGIVLASSGNGCHLLVPVELPNDAASKELVRKIQRLVANEFNTEQVECECFPDANRLIRAYGSVNKKGEETEDLRHRPSAILEFPQGGGSPTEAIEKILAGNPITLAKTNKHSGEGEGPFTRDSLFERLQAWKEGWEGLNGERFEYEETERRDGFRVWCPGNFAEGWADGEAHGDMYENLNDSTIVWVEDGWPRFRCAHNHCGEGSDHGKKTWLDLQTFYDPERRLHRIINEFDNDFAKWNVDFVDDGAGDVGEANIAEMLAESVMLDPPKCQVEEVEEVINSEKTGASENPAEEPKPEQAKRKTRYMPESCMYGWLGEKARELDTPLGYAYPATITVFAARITFHPAKVRPTLYTCLIGPVHCSKSETIKRALASLTVTDPESVKWTVPGSDRGLINIFGGRKKKDDKKDDNDMLPEFAKTRLLAQDELRNTIAKANINGSSLPSTLCSLWSQDEAGAADKQGEHVALVRLNLLGALKAEDPEDFAEVFGKESTSGLYDRFVYGIAPRGWKYNFWTPNPEIRCPTDPEITPRCFEMLAEWRDVNTQVRGRLGEIALRIAYITAAANHDKEISKECMRAALEFVEWQEAIRSTYRAGLGDSIDAQCTNAILSVLEKAEGKWVRWRDISRSKNWYRKYSSTVLSRTREALAKTGMTIEETVADEETKHPRRTGRLRLRQDRDDE